MVKESGLRRLPRMLRLLPRGMGDSIVLDPMDLLSAREKTRQNDGGDSDGGIYFTPRSGRCDSAASENDGAVRPVQFLLNDEGRCSHDARPGFCRMFPLGRLYENGTFSYFLQVSECPKENKTKSKSAAGSTRRSSESMKRLRTNGMII